jgi:hypothetical protein
MQAFLADMKENAIAKKVDETNQRIDGLSDSNNATHIIEPTGRSQEHADYRPFLNQSFMKSKFFWSIIPTSSMMYRHATHE